ncbi:SDR family NAD(P)-dependent oxidoreductase [Corynebacterium flavescens]|uniref:SDR family NAD(P)-dependent oxidoreductase n=1 Tax=Corynebacterium flavescens TaxID=28028 RepID=UPI0028A00D20|nr:SDR family oxidoreductase [Corynebacterium flavescens]
MTRELEAEVAVVTGAFGSIGSAIVRSLLASGHRVIATDTSQRDSARGWIQQEIADGMLDIVLGDAREDQTIEEVESRVRSAGGVNKVFCVAGVYPEKPVGELLREDVYRAFEINTFSPILLINALDSQILPGGAVVLFSSVAGARGSKYHSLYAATKGALVSFGKSAAIEFGDRGIRVNSIAPGVIENEMTAELRGKSGDSIRESTALVRLGTPQEVADSALFLASAEAAFISGATLHVNGGLYM